MAKINNRYIQFYTPGTAAVKVQIQDQKKWAPLPEPKPAEKIAIPVDPVAMVAFVVAVCMLILMAVGIHQLNNTRQEVAALERYIAQLNAENHDLNEQYKAGYDLKEVRSAALSMGLIPIDEVPQTRIYITMPESKVEEPLSNWEKITTNLGGLFA